MPHSRSATPRPALASIDVAAATWRGSPPWEAQASASSAGVRPKASAAPLSTRARACKALTAERGKTSLLDIADGGAAIALGVDNDNGAAMAALDGGIAGDFDENGIGHRRT